MSTKLTNTGVACQCKNCPGPQQYGSGVCQGCKKSEAIEFTWIAKKAKGGGQCPAPCKMFRLNSGACAQLIDSWTNLVLLRGITPYLTGAYHSESGEIRSPEWYVQRGVNCSVQFKELAEDPNFSEKLNSASAWTNQSFVVRAMVTFEAFASDKKMQKRRFPMADGMREFWHVRNLRHAIAHGNLFTDPRLVNEAKALFGSEAVSDESCNFAIDTVLEPLWARLLVYAHKLESSEPLPSDPAVVVASSDSKLSVQTFNGFESCEIKDPDSGSIRRIGEIISLQDIRNP